MIGMKRRRGTLAAVLLSLATAAGATGGEGALDLPAGADFGAGITLSEFSDFGDVVSDPAKYADTPVLVRGTISDVGRVKAETLSEEEARHYAAESIDGDPSAIRGPQEVVSFTATGVRIVSEH
jgi:hypothetical protein